MARIDVLNAPTKPCHNCRRRRLRCDRSYPHCHKCTAAGQECLGYGKLFRWTEGVASRGKLAGKATITFSSAPGPESHSSSLQLADPAASSSSSSGTQHPDLPPAASSSSAEQEPNSALVVSAAAVRPGTQSAPWTLVDPLFQDVEHHYRHYLSYFTTRVCRDLVSWDVPDRNPFRSLVPLTRAHPLLQHIIVAASAAHMSNLSRAVSSDPVADLNARQALNDALIAKHKALRLLSSAIQSIGSSGGVGGDVVLAAVLFFVNVELIESGQSGWKPHLEGAGRIMAFLPPVGSADEALRDYVMSDCFIYYILASAFNTSPPTAAKSYYQSVQASSILGRAAANSYLCCPPDILQILLDASQLSTTEADDLDSTAQAGAQLLEKALAFDIENWAYEQRNISYFQQIPVESRIHAGSAHRIAASLYILHSVPAISKLVSVSRDELDSELYYHLSSISDEDPNFKATCWPTFIAGAGASNPDRRAWALYRLKRLMIATPWGFITTAMDTLQTIWSLEESLDPSTQTERSWVQKLKSSDLNFLIV